MDNNTMTPIERAIREAFRIGQMSTAENATYSGPEIALRDLIERTLQSIQGDAVGYVDQICGRTAMVDIHNGKTLEPGADIYTQPQSPAVVDALKALVAKKKQYLEQYVSEYCHLEPDTNAAVWGAESDQQHAEDVDNFIRELEAMLSASQQGDSNE